MRRAVALVVLLAMSGCSGGSLDLADRFTPREAGVLRVAAVLPSSVFWETDDTDVPIGGFEYEIASELARRLGLRLEVNDLDFASIELGQLGDSDIALAQVARTVDRSARLDLSVSYFDTDSVVVAKRGTAVTDLATARGMSWAYVGSSIQQAVVDAVIMPSAATVAVDDEEAAVAAVAIGSVEAALIDLVTAFALVRDDSSLAVVARIDQRQEYVVVFGSANGDPTRAINRAVVDRAVRAMLADGTVDSLREKWIDPVVDLGVGALPVLRMRVPRL